MQTKCILWLDDLRNPYLLNTKRQHAVFSVYPDTPFMWVKSERSFKRYFEERPSGMVAVSFDNDLGPGKAEGKDLFTWMEQRVREQGLPRFDLFAHTANPAAKQTLLRGFETLNRFWTEQETNVKP